MSYSMKFKPMKLRYNLLLFCVQLTMMAGGQSSRPNIIYIMADDLGWGDLGSYGQKRVKTPNLDWMAQQGVKFTQFYAGSTVCAPSRCALMTGRHTGHAYIRGNGEIPLRSADSVLSQRLKQTGYTTGMFGKWGLGVEGTPGAPQEKGWDRFVGYLDHRHAHNYHTTHLWQVNNKSLSKLPLDTVQYTHDVIMDSALAFIKTNRNQPFFLYLPITLVHAELATTKTDLRPFLTKEGESVFELEKPFVKPAASRYSSQPQPHAAFAAMLTRLDKDVGRLLNLLHRLGIDKNTLVFFTSDNGPHKEGGADPEFFNSNGPWRGIKRDLYEGGIRVPMIVWGSGVKGGGTNNEPWANWDILPTVYTVARTSLPKNIDGISMLPALMGKKTNGSKDRSFFWQFSEGETRQAVLKSNWKLIRFKKAGAPERFELFFLTDDPEENNNIAAAHPQKVSELKAILNQSQTPAEHPEFRWLANEVNK